MTLHCPKCGKSFEKEVFPLGDRVGCPYCRETFNIARQETMPYGPDGGPVQVPTPDGDEPPAPEPEDSPRPKPLKNETVVPEGPLPLDDGKEEPVAVVDEPRGESVGPGSRLGGFLLEEEIGRGGMGVVYLGIQESLNRKVAVKILPAELSGDPQFVGRFQREAKSLANLSHPNIVGVIDKGFDKGHYYFVMEYVKGVSLRDLMDRGEMTPEKSLSLVPPLCDALEYAHSQGVIHRDIKPGNILIDEKGRVKIADFGLARIVRGDARDDGLTRTNLVMGTPDYMAPEQRENPKSVDHRADIFSLGVVIYEMLTGSLPLGRFDPPSKSVGENIHIDVRLDEVVLRALEKDRDRRFQHASEVSSAITGIQSFPGGGSPEAAELPEGGGYLFPLDSGSTIEIRTVDADVVLRAVRGPAEVKGAGRIAAGKSGNVLSIDAKPGAGKVEVAIPVGIPATVSTVSGDVRGTDLATRLSVRTSTGDVSLTGFRGALRVDASSGDLTLRHLDVEDLQIRTGTSDVLIDGLKFCRGAASVQCGEGDVRINVDGRRSSFRYRLSSEGGDLLTPDGTPVGSAADGRIGGGEGWLQVECGGGDIALDITRHGKRAGGRRGEVAPAGRKRGKGWVGFFNHFGAYAIVCGGLLALNLATSPGSLWVLWVMTGWGMGLGIHFWSVLMRTLMGQEGGPAGRVVHLQRVHRIAWDRPWASISHHVGSFLAVNGFLLFVNLYTGPGYLWCLWPAAFWGFGLAVHVWVSLVRWLREVWDEEGGVPTPTLEAVEGARNKIRRKWAGFFSHLGVYAIVNGFLVGLNLYSSGTISWSLWVITGWGIGIFTGFWSAMTDTMVYISMEKAFRLGDRQEGGRARRFPLLMPSLFNGLVLLVAAFLWFGVPLFVPAYQDGAMELPQVTGALIEGARAVREHSFAFWGGILAFLGVSFGFYFGTGAPRWVQVAYVTGSLLLLTGLAFGAWFALAPLVIYM